MLTRLPQPATRSAVNKQTNAFFREAEVCSDSSVFGSPNRDPNRMNRIIRIIRMRRMLTYSAIRTDKIPIPGVFTSTSLFPMKIMTIYDGAAQEKCIECHMRRPKAPFILEKKFSGTRKNVQLDERVRRCSSILIEFTLAK